MLEAVLRLHVWLHTASAARNLCRCNAHCSLSPHPAQLTASAVVARSAAPLRSTTCSARQGAEKLIISKMLEQHSNRRTFPVDRHAGMAVAGVAADGRSVVSRAMGEVGPPARDLPAVCCL